MKVDQSQAMEQEFKPIDCQFYVKDHLNQFERSVEALFLLRKRRKYYFLVGSEYQFLSIYLTALLLLALLVIAITLQSDNNIIINIPNGNFKMHETWDPPISIEILETQSHLILDVQFQLDAMPIEHQTIETTLYSGQSYQLTTIDQDYIMSKEYAIRFLAISLKQQFSSVPQSYLIIQAILFSLSFIYLLVDTLRYSQL